jgi:hypothetical protein
MIGAMSVDAEPDDDGDPGDDELEDDRELEELDDVRDRKELRQRYYTLLQELRVVLPGIQVLAAFLLTAPFAQRFPDLDAWGEFTYGVSLVASILSVICLLTPTVYHRTARRNDRVGRLRWGIRMTIIGQWLIAVALMFAMWCITQLVFGFQAAWLFTIPMTIVILSLWLVLPKVTSKQLRELEESGASRS